MGIRRNYFDVERTIGLRPSLKPFDDYECASIASRTLNFFRIFFRQITLENGYYSFSKGIIFFSYF